jgi:hypothetical protein
MKNSFLILVLSFFSTSLGWGVVTLPNVIGNNMVLQRDLPVPIWGWAEPGEQVNVSFDGQSKTTLADGGLALLGAVQHGVACPPMCQPAGRNCQRQLSADSSL